MGDYHFVYKDVEGASTQWDDIQRKLGNLPPKPAPFKPPPFTPSTDPDLDPKSKSWIDDRNPEELEDLEDDPDLDDDRFLEEYSIPDCELLLRSLEELAARYPATKFVKIISTECIPNYPDRNLPTILVYNNGAVKGTYVGLHHFGSRKCTPEAVALALCQSDPVLNDGQGGDSSKDAVIEGVRKRLIEKVVTTHEDGDEDYESD